MSGRFEVEEDEVIVVELGEVDALFPEIGRIDVEVGMGQHQFDAARRRGIVFDQENAHSSAPQAVCPKGTLVEKG
jgi:hypothetical protein